MKKFVQVLCALFVLLLSTLYLSSFIFTKATDPKEEYLYMYLTTDLHNRFTNYLVGSTSDSVNPIQYSGIFASDFRKLTTEKFYQTMLSNREPLKYDLTAFEQGYQTAVQDIYLKEKDRDQGLYSFQVTVTERTKKETLNYQYSGHLNVDESGKISGFRLQNRKLL